ncbi:glycosyltransferase, putative [Entamoeba histolytica HM-1:IMSS-B]|uniref:Glycosyltransferase, putative n=6 Tax=Entamoeba histolytica TaxID=5759 RepID=C4LW53_ENTH1|nr:glycosyltransferase, putative [Entamoeba histolytica HM-1:IMSS]EMD45671.1 capsular polysaccharide phosphotransferase sacB, putative [Entamoeba histolytica KU27]EMH75620.1 glycosyltransferase, putative [Entamoeba histolytica HM-1:IMSS-B]ENY65046.1 capsular polysaccharide phosphotransferase sacB, putative [Entamoeba histolytica HM-1:IMSS-A]GAT92926.1 glycosyltransferase putative [Entamoeba histolytica]EAL45381.1 glycosyltransferase, putative [Entamoeba histolytica HM-1:IMSS]|eukprot:XP_650771.1 glycosyltransferase, putative [Entamoeba histolytica HM-1:IMSS]
MMILFICFVSLIKDGYSLESAFERVCNGKADAVFLWVNGTSPHHLEEMSKYGRTKIGGLYKDYGTIRFGLRSIIEYAPWINRIFLVTDGEIPEYLDIEKGKESNPQLILVSHRDIMNVSILPTFDSNVIESYIHHIPGISKCVLYLNDDMILGKPLQPDFFISKDSKLRVYHNGFIAPNIEGEKRSIWHRSVSHTNKLVNQKFRNGEVVKHPYPSHHCYFMLTNTLNEMEEIWIDNYTESRENKFRKANDIVISFLHAATIVEQHKGEYVKQKNNFYFSWWGGNHTLNSQTMDRIATKHYYCICLNDAIANEPNADQEIDYLYQRYSEILPHPCPFEKF